VTKPQNRLNINKGRCNLKVFRIDFKEGIFMDFRRRLCRILRNTNEELLGDNF
jgi:hypothetical protein